MSHARWLNLAGLSLALMVTACSGSGPAMGGGGGGGTSTLEPQPLPSSPPVQENLKPKLCPPRSRGADTPELTFNGQAGAAHSGSYRALQSAVSSACMNCHQAPAASGGFTYIAAYAGRTDSIGGIQQYYPGLSEIAERMSGAILSGAMPPPQIRQNNPDGFNRIGEDLRAWIGAGKPDGPFVSAPDPQASPSPSATPAPEATLQPMTDLGECTPKPEAMGYDFRKDRYFESLDKLPGNLTDTDLFTLDAYLLARKGTVAYNVEYPLWADNSSKGRWIHVPMLLDRGNHLQRQPLQLDGDKFKIPENTRVYKTFYKPWTGADGKRRFKRIETRLIVVRYPAERTLYGTYLWDESQQSATLVTTPYRDGTPWKDYVFDVVVNDRTGQTHKYALPARHRCEQCHMGSESGSFLLGLAPLQLNRRGLGDAGREEETGPDDRSQVSRLLKYGVLSGFGDGAALPRLEATGLQSPRNIEELRAQAYMVGNCAHCHNPDGFAMKLNEVKLDLRAGQIYNFNTKLRSIHFPVSQEHRFVDPQGDLERSYLYQKLALPPAEQGLYAQMPLNTPGTPDCHALEVMGRWIKTWAGTASPAFVPDCEPRDDFDWLEQDFTWPDNGTYVPRRADWVQAMPDAYKAMEFPPELQQISRRDVAVGYWNLKPGCKFPDVQPQPGQLRPWMVDDQGKLKRPFGEVYTARPGAWFFTNTCSKCHGPAGDGNSTFATALLNWSGGSVRVANLMKGLFSNLQTFDTKGPDGKSRNLGGNYLLWMATEGTKVQFPAEASNYLGKHKAQMLNMFREKCASYIPSAQQVTKPTFQDYEIFRDVCYFRNGKPDDPAIQFDPNTGEPVNPPALEKWMDRAAFNAGWTIFDYLTTASTGKWWPSNDSCAKQ